MNLRSFHFLVSTFVWQSFILLGFLFSLSALASSAPLDFVTPLVLDLDGNGKVDLVSPFDLTTRVHFSFTGDNYKPRTGWVQKGDGFLVLDVNGNGIIDNGSEMFGPYFQLDQKKSNGFFQDGFAALATLDRSSSGKSDHKIDSNDLEFSRLMVWQDTNQDGVSQKEELKTLDQVGIKDIRLKVRKILPSHSIYRNADNEIKLLSEFVFKNGKSGMIADVWFKQRQIDL